MKYLFVLLFPLSMSFSSQNMEQIYLKNACNSCHGMYGEGIGTNPRLQGVREDILLKRLKNLQHGKTRTNNGTVMISFAKALDKNQTIQMAKYLSTLKTKINNNRYDEVYDPNDDGGS